MAYRPNFPRTGLGGAGSAAVGTRARPDHRPRAGAGRRRRRAGRCARHLRPARRLPCRSIRKGQALTPCLIWMDRRAQAEIADVPAALVRARAGVVLDASHMAAKIRWLKRHDAARGRGRPLPSAGVLSGRPADRPRGDGPRAGLHQHALRHRAARLRFRRCSTASRSSADELPELADAAEAAGPLVGARARRLTGLPRRHPCRRRHGRRFLDALGRRIDRRPGSSPSCSAPARWSARCIRGWSSTMPAWWRPTPIPAARTSSRIPAGCRAARSPGSASCCRSTGSRRCTREAATAPPGADGVTFIPALTGAMAPEWNASARGCFYGLTPSHGRAASGPGGARRVRLRHARRGRPAEGAGR